MAAHRFRFSRRCMPDDDLWSSEIDIVRCRFSRSRRSSSYVDDGIPRPHKQEKDYFSSRLVFTKSPPARRMAAMAPVSLQVQLFSSARRIVPCPAETGFDAPHTFGTASVVERASAGKGRRRRHGPGPRSAFSPASRWRLSV